jgi:hypothetical protein
MLEQKEDDRGARGVEPGGEQQIAVTVGEGRIDERTGLRGQRVPRDDVADRDGEQPAQQGRRVGGIFERRLEQRIVRTSGHDGRRGQQALRQCIPRES